MAEWARIGASRLSLRRRSSHSTTPPTNVTSSVPRSARRRCDADTRGPGGLVDGQVRRAPGQARQQVPHREQRRRDDRRPPAVGTATQQREQHAAERRAPPGSPSRSGITMATVTSACGPRRRARRDVRTDRRYQAGDHVSATTTSTAPAPTAAPADPYDAPARGHGATSRRRPRRPAARGSDDTDGHVGVGQQPVREHVRRGEQQQAHRQRHVVPSHAPVLSAALEEVAEHLAALLREHSGDDLGRRSSRPSRSRSQTDPAAPYDGFHAEHAPGRRGPATRRRRTSGRARG